jgi:hypothetical protein
MRERIFGDEKLNNDNDHRKKRSFCVSALHHRHTVIYIAYNRHNENIYWLPIKFFFAPTNKY